MTVTWALHRLNGVSSPSNATYSVAELTYQLQDAEATALFTVVPLLPTALKAAEAAGIPKDRVFICDMPIDSDKMFESPRGFSTVPDLVSQGQRLGPLEAVRWAPGQGSRQSALLCYSSGTTGLPVSTVDAEPYIHHQHKGAKTLKLRWKSRKVF